jgi:hypothetical protein
MRHCHCKQLPSDAEKDIGLFLLEVFVRGQVPVS